MGDKKSFSYELNGVISYMKDVLGLEYPTDTYTLDYLIVSLLDSKKCHANIILDNCLMSDNIKSLREVYMSSIVEGVKPSLKNDKTVQPKFTDALNNILRLAEVESDKLQSSNIGSEHILLAMLNPSNNIKAGNVFQTMGLNYDSIIRKCEIDTATKRRSRRGIINNNGGMINNTKSGINIITNVPSSEYISKFTINVSKMVEDGSVDELIGRETELGQVIKIFARRKKNNAILVGSPGVGKTQIVYGLANRILEGRVPKFLLNKEIVMLDIMAVVSGTGYRGMLEERIDNLFKELKRNKRYILFLDNIHTMLRSGSKEKDTDISGLILDALNSGDVQIIAATNPKEYRNTIEINSALASKFQKVIVEANTQSEAMLVLKGIKHNYEKFHNVFFGDEVIDKMLRLSERYISDSCLPDSAINLMDSVGAYVSIKNGASEEIIGFKARLNDIEAEKLAALNAGNFESVESLNLEEEEVKRKLDIINKRERDHKPVIVTDDDVSVVVSEITNVPIQKLNSNDKKNIAKIDETLKNIVIGQDEAIEDICKSIKRSRVGLGYKSATRNSFMFLGKSGQGKTLLAKALASEIYGDEKALIRLDMSEYAEKNSVSKLYGSAPGYVGFENGGQLTEAVKNKPYSVILLDEIEKADPEVYNVFLQLLDEGRLTDSAGHTVSFKNCMIIMTSNVGTKQASEMGAGIGFSADAKANKRNVIEKELKKKFPPEFLNRIDKIVYFNELNDDNLKDIIKLEINKFSKRLSELNYNFAFDDSVIEHLHKLSKEQSEYGARPIIRLIQDNIEDNITDLLLNNEYEPSYTFSGTCVDGRVIIK